MGFSRQAQGALTARPGVQLADHAVTDRPRIPQARSNLRHGAAVLVPHYDRRRAGEFIVIDVKIGAADAAIFDLDQKFVVARWAHRHIPDGYVTCSSLVLHQSTHVQSLFRTRSRERYPIISAQIQELLV